MKKAPFLAENSPAEANTQVNSQADEQSGASNDTSNLHDRAKPARAAAESVTKSTAPAEIGGRQGPDPTRYGDWEKGGRCIDF